MKFNCGLLKKDINKYARSFAKAYVPDVVKQLEIEAKNCAMYFYSTYEPDYYERTYQFLDNSVTSKTWAIKGGYSGYVDLNSDISNGSLSYVPHGIPYEVIREENWNGNRITADSTSPSPISFLESFYNNKGFNNNDAIEKAKSIARNQGYSCIKKV